MAHQICGSDDADAETLEWARRIAEAQVDLTRVRNSRRQLVTRYSSILLTNRRKSTASSFELLKWF